MPAVTQLQHPIQQSHAAFIVDDRGEVLLNTDFTPVACGKCRRLLGFTFSEFGVKCFYRPCPHNGECK